MPEAVGLNYFAEARKLALKEYSKSVSNGQVGYLPSLEGLIKNSDIVSEVNLGIVEIPLKKIIGTYSHLRSLSFAKNFMPLLEIKTEFQSKWSSLCEAHLKVGIRHSIKVYEYLNWFYVIEGNKRVSVLKFFNAYSITAEVIRLIPKKDKSNVNIRIYYEFLKFNKLTDIYAIWFTKEKSYELLYEMLESFNPDLKNFNDKYKCFEVDVYQVFRRIYLELGGQKLPITTGDAYLEYAKIYGINQIIDEKELANTLKEFLIELNAISKEDNLDVVTSPIESTQNAMISALTTLIMPSKILKVAFVYSRTIETSGWTYAHELGRIYVQNALKDSIITSYIENVPENDDAYDYIKALAEEDNDIIFTTSPVFLNSTLRCAIEFPQIKFFNCSEATPYQHVTSYYGRTYESRFLTGIIAGAMTKSNVVGYVATKPTPEAFSSINAFALGAKLVNPYLKVIVEWTNDWNNRDKFKDAGNKLIKKNSDIICNRIIEVEHPVSTEYGVYSMLCTIDLEKGLPDKYLATPIWQWGVYYEKILSNIINDTFKTVVDMFSTNSKLLNFWWGIEAGVIDIFYSKELVPLETQKLVNLMKRMIINSEYHPFTGPIYDQSGAMKIDFDETANHEQILTMDWLVDIVETKSLDVLKDSH